MQLKIIFIISLFIFTFFVQNAFAADAQISGKILDNNNNPISQGVLVFVDSAGNTISAATSDMAGLYQSSIPEGTYTVSVEGPKGSGLQKVTLQDKKIFAVTNLDFILTSPKAPLAKKPNLLQIVFPYLIGFLTLFLVGIGIYLFWRKKRVPPLSQPSSPN